MPPRPNLLTREINLGPLVDLGLVLLIVLVVVLPLLRPPASPPAPQVAGRRSVAPAGAAAAAPLVGMPHLAVAIGADGSVFVEQRRVARRELTSLLATLHAARPNRPVLVKGNRRLRYREVRALMADLYRAGFQRIALTWDAPPA